jgi:alanine-synthesizing transaminase
MNLLEQARRRYITGHGESALLDLTNSHFGRAGIEPPQELYDRTYRNWRQARTYRPSGRGGTALRCAIADFMNRPGHSGPPVDPEHVVATAGSSVSYHLVFSWLRRRATEITGTDRSLPPLVALPKPGYPLFEDLAAHAGVSVGWYGTSPEKGFQPDLQEIHRRLEEGARCVVVISPGNPTGVVTDSAALAAVEGLCREYGALLLVDEVFQSFVSEVPPTSETTASETSESTPLTARLNGLSKAFAAPDIKLGWIACSGGKSGEAEEMVQGLDTVHDTYLTLSGYAEAAGPVFLSDPRGLDAMEGIRREVLQRRDNLDAALAQIPALQDCRSASLHGGIHRMLKIDPIVAAERFGTLDDEAIAVLFMERYGVYLHPGYLYGMEDAFPDRGPWIVITCLHTAGAISAAGEGLLDILG